MHVAVLEATYLHWKEDGDKRLTDDDLTKIPDNFKKNEGKVSNFYILVTDGSHTIHILAPYILLNGQYCLETQGKGEPIYRQELFAPQCFTIDKKGEYPQWFFDALGDSSSYDAMEARSLKHGDWGITAEFCHFYDLTTNLMKVEAELQAQ